MLTNDRTQPSRPARGERFASASSVIAAPPRPVTDAGSGRVFMESWLEKKAEWRFAWDRRYLTLDGSRMSYRVDEDAAEKGVGTVASLDCNTDHSELVFRVWLLEGGCWTLRAPDLALYERWLEALLTALQPSGAAFNGASLSAPAAMPVSQPPREGPSGSARPPTPNHRQSNDTANSAHSHPQDRPQEDDSRTHTGSRTSGGASCPWGPVQLSAQVDKQAAWTGRWKSRVIELYEIGNQLAYKRAPRSAVKQRYTVTAVDLAVRTASLATGANRALSPHVGCLMLVSTSVGERFWVKFATAGECQTWYRALHTKLQQLASWQWGSIPEDAAASVPLLPDGLTPSVATGANLILDNNGSHNYASFRVHYHCAAVAPITTSSGGAGGTGVGFGLVVFGGANRLCQHVFHPGAKAFVPMPRHRTLLNSLSMLQLFGSHAQQTVPILPFEEQPHVKVRPPPLFGATMVTVCKKTTGVQLNRTSVSAVQVVLVGGMTTGSQLLGLARSEVWSAVLSPHAHLLADGVNTDPLPDFVPFWRKTSFPLYELPTLTFHSAADVSHVVTAALARRSRRRGHDDAEASATILLTGGLDPDFRARGECHLLRWPYYETNEQQPAPPTVSFFGYLPEPRGFHGMATLHDGTVVLVGGRGVSNNDIPPILTLPPSALEQFVDATKTPVNEQEEEHGRDERSSNGEAGRARAAVERDSDEPVSPWLRVQWHADQWALPPLPSVAVAATEAGDRVVALAQLTSPRSQVKLFVMTFQEVAQGRSGAGEQLPRHTMRVRWQEVNIKVGAVPRSVSGASIHVYNDFIYVIGALQHQDGHLDDHGPITLGEDGQLAGQNDRLSGPLRILMPPA